MLCPSGEVACEESKARARRREKLGVYTLEEWRARGAMRRNINSDIEREMTPVHPQPNRALKLFKKNSDKICPRNGESGPLQMAGQLPLVLWSMVEPENANR